jgi:two-component system, NtrC family, response regulator AtoC
MAASASLGIPFKSAIEPVPPDSIIFGKSAAMDLVRQRIEKVAGTNLPILISGESGTGKDILARLIHKLSPWSTGPFVKINCPAIPGTLMESELFGYEKGAFTGANAVKPGRVEMAHRGTLFVDEISELELGLQSKLLQVLQEGQFCRIGAQEDKKVEARIVCASNRNLQAEIDGGRFRQDLFYRINVVNVTVPPLRERKADIPTLVRYFWETYNARYNRRTKLISEALMSKLVKHDWPGNVRELENVVKRYVVLESEESIIFEPTQAWRSGFALDIPIDGPISLKELTRHATREFESQIIVRVLQQNRWNRRRTAKALNISYRALLYKLKQSSISRHGRHGGTAIVEGADAP